MTLSQKLVILRKTKGITQDEFARVLDVSRQSVHKWESGQCFPEVPKIIKIKELYGISIDDLLDDGFEIPMPDKKKRRSAKKDDAVQIQESQAQEAAPVLNKTENEAENKVEPVLEEIAVDVIENAEKAVAPDGEELKTEEQVKAPSEKEVEYTQEKKKGFFSKIFGRK